jgi:hypothetical protein
MASRLLLPLRPFVCADVCSLWNVFQLGFGRVVGSGRERSTGLACMSLLPLLCMGLFLLLRHICDAPALQCVGTNVARRTILFLVSTHGHMLMLVLGSLLMSLEAGPPKEKVTLLGQGDWT